MNEKTKRIYRIYLLGAAALTLLLTVLRTAETVLYLDAKTGYFAQDSRLHAAANVITVAAVLLCLSAAPVFAGKLRVQHRAPHLPTLFSSAFVAFLLFAFAFFHFLEIAASLKDGGASPEGTAPILSSGIAAVLSLGGAAALMLSAASRREISVRKALACCLVVLFCLVYAMYLYFESELPLNADVKLLSQTALLACAVFFLYDARISLGKPRWALRLGVGLSAMLLSASVSLPDLIYYLLSRSSVLQTPLHDFLLFGFFLYILARTVSLCDCAPAPAEGFFAQALEIAQHTPDEQISFFGAEITPEPADGEQDEAAEELLAPPPTETDAEEDAEPEENEGTPEPAPSEPLLPPEPAAPDCDLSELFGAPIQEQELVSENDILTGGAFAREDEESEP